MVAEKGGKSRAAAAASAVAALAAASAATSAASGARCAAARAQIVEEEEEDDDGNEAGTGRFVWDATKGMLVDADAGTASAGGEGTAHKGDDGVGSQSVGTPDAENKVAGEPGASAGNKDGEKESEESGDDEDSEEEGDADVASRSAFLNEASTPELMKQAVSIGGTMAQGVSDRWVLDKATQLYFHYSSRSQRMHCWNPSQCYLHLWRGRGILEFVWAASASGSLPPASFGLPLPPGLSPAAEVSPPSEVKPAMPAPAEGSAADAAAAEAPGVAAAAAASAVPAMSAGHGRSLWVTVIPPSVLETGGADPHAKTEEEMEVPSRALGQIIGAGHAGLKELQFHSGASITVRPRGEQETAAHLQLKGTKAQISAAKNAIEQKLVLAIGAAKVERLQKHQTSELMAKLNAETGTDAATGGVAGLTEFAEKWSLKAVLVRKLRKLDAMFQRYLIRHFKPWKAKPANALRSYVTTLLMPPQRWRLQALHEDGELDGEVCETAMVGEAGALVGSEYSQDLGVEVGDSGTEQFIELEVDRSVGEREASRIYGDVQPQHCRFLRMGEDFYVWALETHVGTVLDSKKYRQSDGPIPVRDGSIVAIGKYLLYCEVGAAAALQDRRRRLLAGENFWKILNASLPKFKAQSAGEVVAEDKQAVDASGSTALPKVFDEEDDEEERVEDKKATAPAEMPKEAVGTAPGDAIETVAPSAAPSDAPAATPDEMRARAPGEDSEGQGTKRKLEELADGADIDFSVQEGSASKAAKET